MRRFAVIIWTLIFFAGTGFSQSRPPIEAYGELPSMSFARLSPDGQKLAFVGRDAERNILVVLDLETNESIGININELRTEKVEWSDSKHIVFQAFDNTRLTGYRGKFRYSAAFAINVETGKARQLLRNTEGLYPAQSGLGHIVGRLEDSGRLLMPAFMGTGRNPSYDLLRVDPDRGRGANHTRGTTDTIDWFVDRDGTVLAQENYDNKSNRYWVRTRATENGSWKTVLDQRDVSRPRGLAGVSPDRDALLFLWTGENGFTELRGISMDGEALGLMIGRQDADINSVVSDINRVVYGVEYGGLQPTYEFFDQDLQNDVDSVQATFPETSTQLFSWTDDWSKLLFFVAGTGQVGNYYIFDRREKQLTFVSSSRSGIPQDAVADVLTVEYRASDGLTIPGVLTVPAGVEMDRLPLIVMPHGGPESHDQVGFHWMAQYFANRGFLVLQPNFRGSDGFGTKFIQAGHGEWGGAMQQDITDGVQALIRGGQADPDRICIVGWSYGGYAALAGGAFTPDLYKCVAAIAPVSDLARMLSDEKSDHGKDHWVVGYWERAMADGDATRDVLRERSPAMYADAFQAPVLLIHGKDDLIVPAAQSRRMRNALRDAGKSVRLVEYRGEDHSLLSPGARLKLLQELDTFVHEHIGGETG
ncbi:MAG: prolyl oligopeptidase family serine peptidase [Pseudomonadota bacterium]